ncbi:unnamed protein product [Cylicostephanus goldi]|uniref:ShKT domain-containing protein n=1 Tax=Cylicostephanus goldi TaxID=71465 RepID=A0A3P6RB60_CYLGO|nr:unnamed protein product [Cylicostephanus goldi]
MSPSEPAAPNGPTNPSNANSIPCEDKVNPRTGISDCPLRQYLCNDPRYYALMTDQCPKTCNRCEEFLKNYQSQPQPQPQAPSSSSDTECKDLVHPRTGISDCPHRAHLCFDPNYRSFMQIQCPKTCGYC